MRRKKKNSGLARLLLFTIAFLILVGIIALMAKQLAPDDPSRPSHGSTDAGISTENNASPESEINAQELTQIAASLFAEETFSAGHLTVYDLTEDVMLYEKNADAKITAASTTKLLTALTMLEYVGEDTVFTAGSELELVGAGSSSADLVKGQTLTVDQILDALLIPSGNDAAYVIAAHVGRNLSGDPQITDADAVSLFVEKMNGKATALGAENSLFTCPDGYPDSKQYTTAKDMTVIAVAASKNATIRKTVEKTYSEIAFPDGSVVGYVNTNQLMIPSSAYYYEGTFGMKTGSTPKAGQCLIAGATAYGHELIVTVFKAPDNAARYTDSRNAFDLGFKAVKQAQEKEQ